MAVPNITDKTALVSEDVFSYVDVLETQINRFLGRVFRCLNDTLSDDEVRQICGVFGGRLYTRYVRPGEAVDFDSGRCDAFRWFEKPDNPTCPLKDDCGAYLHRHGEPCAAANDGPPASAAKSGSADGGASVR